MCGRTAQSQAAVHSAAFMLRGSSPQQRHASGDGSNRHNTQDRSERVVENFSNDLNLSPGHRAVVFHASQDEKEQIECSEKVWGLVPRGGTKASPIAMGPSQHFANLMFNARADTLYDKVTFRTLALTPGRTCVWAVDGFYEWKDQTNAHQKGKQPYFVHNSDGSPLLMAGLWTKVHTGRPNSDYAYPEPLGLPTDNDEHILHTFTVITTDACPDLKWLHHRMPLVLSCKEDAIEWLRRPSKELHQRLARECSCRKANHLAWHPVTKKMSKSTYRGEDCNTPIKLDTIPSVKSFFANAPPKSETSSRKHSEGTPDKSLSKSSSVKTVQPKSSPVSKRMASGKNVVSSSKRIKATTKTPAKGKTLDDFFKKP